MLQESHMTPSKSTRSTSCQSWTSSWPVYSSPHYFLCPCALHTGLRSRRPSGPSARGLSTRRLLASSSTTWYRSTCQWRGYKLLYTLSSTVTCSNESSNLQIPSSKQLQKKLLLGRTLRLRQGVEVEVVVVEVQEVEEEEGVVLQGVVVVEAENHPGTSLKTPTPTTLAVEVLRKHQDQPLSKRGT